MVNAAGPSPLHAKIAIEVGKIASNARPESGDGITSPSCQRILAAGGAGTRPLPRAAWPRDRARPSL